MSHRKLNPQKQSLTVGDVARRSGVAVSTVHYYEAKGLIESTRNAGNQRRFSRDVLRRVAVIKIAQRTGMPLAEIKASLDDLPTSRTPDAEDWRHLSEQWRGALDERIRCLIALRDQLDGCIGCGCLSLKSCPLRNPEDVLGDAEEGEASPSVAGTGVPGR